MRKQYVINLMSSLIPDNSYILTIAMCHAAATSRLC